MAASSMAAAPLVLLILAAIFVNGARATCATTREMRFVALPTALGGGGDVFCSDGSVAGYYIDDEQTGSGLITAENYLIWLGDSELCADASECTEFCAGQRNRACRESPLPPVGDAAAINSSNAECYFHDLMCSSANWNKLALRPETVLCGESDSVFGDYQRVFVPSCSLDWFLGTGDAESGSSNRFLGANIFDAVVADLAIGAAAEIVVGGTRGGGVGASHHVSRLQALLPTATVRLLLDSSWFVNERQFGVNNYIETDVSFAFDERLRRNSGNWLAGATILPSCAAIWSVSAQVHRCLYPSNLISLAPLSTANVFVAQSQFDLLQLNDLGVTEEGLEGDYVDEASYSQAVLSYIKGHGITMRQSFEESTSESLSLVTLESPHDFWSPGCGQHGFLVPTDLHTVAPRTEKLGDAGSVTFARTGDEWEAMAVRGLSLRAALALWKAGAPVVSPSPADNEFVENGIRADRCGEFLCNPTCPSTVISFGLEDKTTPCEQTVVVGYCIFFIVFMWLAFLAVRLRVVMFDRTCANFAARSKRMLEQTGELNSGKDAEKQMLREARAANHGRSIMLAVSDLSYWAPPKGRRGKPFQILHQVNVAFRPGGVHAMMGPSGSGKSTLLDVVSYTRETGQVTGEHLINGVPSHLGRAAFLREWLRNSASYVRQTDVLFPFLTVRQHLQHAAWLMMPQFSSNNDKLYRVEQVIQLLELQGCADTICGDGGVRVEGGISGGQRRRVSVATQLLNMPAALLLDEPTSGLDSTNALVLVQSLHNLAHKANVNVIMTIHQPRREIFALLDDVTILVRGRIIFSGPPADAADFFGVSLTEVNIGDEILDQLQAAKPERIEKYRRDFSEGALGQRVRDAIDSDRTHLTVEMARALRTVLVENALAAGRWSWSEPTSAMTALWVLVSRTIKRGGFDVWRTSLFSLVGGLLVGAVFLGNDTYTGQIALAYLATSTLTFLSSTFLGDRYNLEKGVWSFEKDNGTRVPYQAFLVSIFLRNVVASSMEGLAYAIPVFFMGFVFQESQVLFNYLLIMLLTSIAVTTQNTTVEIFTINRGGDSAPDTRKAALINMSLLAMSALFNGFIIALRDIPVFLQWLPYLMLSFYGFIGLFINALGPFSLDCDASKLECAQRTGANFVRTFDYDVFDLYICMFALLMLIILLHAISYAAFFFKFVYAQDNLKRGAPKDAAGDEEDEAFGKGGRSARPAPLLNGAGTGEIGSLQELAAAGKKSKRSGAGSRGRVLSTMLSRQALLLYFLVDVLFAFHLCFFTEGVDLFSDDDSSAAGAGLGAVNSTSLTSLDLGSSNPGFILLNLVLYGVYAAQFIVQALFLVPLSGDGKRGAILWLSRHDLFSLVFLAADAGLVLSLLVAGDDNFGQQVGFTFAIRVVRFCFVVAFYLKVDAFHRYRARALSGGRKGSQFGDDTAFSFGASASQERKARKTGRVDVDGPGFVAPPPGVGASSGVGGRRPLGALSGRFGRAPPPLPNRASADLRRMDLGPMWAAYQRTEEEAEELDDADDQA